MISYSAHFPKKIAAFQISPYDSDLDLFLHPENY